MYHFERGKDPKETLEVGAKKDAIKITGVGYFLDDKEHHITNPIKAHIFMEKLKNGELPNDPIFGIESVFVWHDNRDMEEDWESKINRSFHNHNRIEPEYEKYKEVKNTRTYEIDEIHGQVLDMCGKLILFPTLEELEKAGFGYLEKYHQGEEMVRENERQIEQYLMNREHELREEKMKEERRLKEMREKAERDKAEMICKAEQEKMEEEWHQTVESAKKGTGIFLKGNWGIFGKNSGPIT